MSSGNIGRPAIGGAVRVRLGDLVEFVDAYAREHGLFHAGEPNRSEAVRRIVAKARDEGRDQAAS